MYQDGRDVKTLLQMGHWAPWEACNASSLRDVATVVASTANGGRFSLAGTVTEAAGQPPQYNAQPANRLVWERAGQKPVEFYFTDMKGDLSDQGRNYLIRPLSIKYRVVIEGELDLTVEGIREKTG